MKRVLAIVCYLLLSPIFVSAETEWTEATDLQVCGKIVKETAEPFSRLPQSCQGISREKVWNLGRCSSGLYVRFRTDSPLIELKWESSQRNTLDNMSMINVRGLDLYIHNEGRWQYVGSGRPRNGTPYKASFTVDALGKGMHEYMLYLSMYDGVKDLSIGIEKGCSIKKPKLDSPRQERPVIMYGTSILQGGSSSRPGLSSTNLLSRELNRTVINLGFSGNAHLDMEIAELMANYPDPGVFVLDNIPNGSPELTREKEEQFFRVLRSAHPEVPVIFIGNPIYPRVKFSKKAADLIADKNLAVREVFDKLVADGEKHIYFIPGEKLLSEDGDGTIDGTHFTDVSYRRYADAVKPVILEALAEKENSFRQSVQAPIGDIRALYLEFGHNMWCDWPLPTMGQSIEDAVKQLPERRRPDLKLKATDESWTRITNYAAKNGVNMLVVDLGEALIYPSHPELAIEGSWTPEKMRKEIKRLNKLGIEVIPKLNFSSTHNGWMKHYRHMVSTEPYYKMCEDVISDVMTIFGHPRFFHIGYDEENYDLQKKSSYICIRSGNAWWADFLRIVDMVSTRGARPWMWSDYGWENDDFYERCPKCVIHSNWYYDHTLGGFSLEENQHRDRNQIETFYKLEKAGFDQIPCGTNWASRVRREAGVGGEDIIGKDVILGRKAVSKEHLYGFLMAPWDTMDENGEKTFLRAIELFADALKQ